MSVDRTNQLERDHLDIITPVGGTGVTSELSVRLHHVAAFHREHGRLPDGINGRQQFWLYRDHRDQDVSLRLFEPVHLRECARSDFNHGWQNAWYDEIDVDNLSRMVKATCWPSGEVAIASKIFYDKLCGRTAVVYRGNDKCKEIPAVSYDTMIAMARDCGADAFILQTDELDFYEHFKSHFPNTVHYENFPMIRRNPNSYVIAPAGQRARFAVEFYAAVIALARARQLLLVTGNVGLWCALWRGSVENLWQADGRSQTWRRLG